MEYIFEGGFEKDKENNKNYFPIPFNVWEVCEDNIGEIPVHVKVNGKEFDCVLEPIKNGYYNIPLTDAQAAGLYPKNFYSITFSINGKDGSDKESSPSSYDNPIRKIDSMEVLIQPWDGLCGQSVFAMLAGITIEEAGNIMHCREWQANMAKIVSSLDYAGIRHSGKIIYTRGKDIELPKCCIIMEHLGRFSHYLVGYNGKYYDPNDGVQDKIDKANIKGYLEIICD